MTLEKIKKACMNRKRLEEIVKGSQKLSVKLQISKEDYISFIENQLKELGNLLERMNMGSLTDYLQYNNLIKSIKS